MFRLLKLDSFPNASDKYSAPIALIELCLFLRKRFRHLELIESLLKFLYNLFDSLLVLKIN